MMAFIYPASRLIRGLVVEKETKLREGMQMMGLEAWTLDLSWFITAALQFLLTSLLITAATASAVFEFMDQRTPILPTSKSLITLAPMAMQAGANRHMPCLARNGDSSSITA
eukprot:SAG22_NODE_206_length_15281_cov_6.078975_9_plen_112_part_00